MKLKSYLGNLVIFVGLCTSTNLLAQIDGDPEVLAKRGNGQVTHDDFAARASAIPEDVRFQVIRNRSRFQEMLNGMLMYDQMAADAREAGFADDPVMQRRMAIAAQEELAKAWLDHVADSAPPADYVAMAREEFKLNRDSYQTVHSIDVTHILISTETRSDEAAMEIVQEIQGQLDAGDASFDALVPIYSEDPGSNSTGGSYKGVTRGQMVPAFENQAFSLSKGQISEPVQTQYGYHLIRLDADTPPRQRRFSEVRAGLVEQMKQRHKSGIQEDYLQQIYAPELKVTEESVENTIERLFGPEVLSKYDESQESE